MQKHLRDEADRLYSIEIRKRDKVCIICYIQASCDCHHIFGRDYAIRWNPEGGAGVCRSCHQWAEANPKMAEAWFRQRMGDTRFDELRALSRTTAYPVFDNVKRKILEINK